MNLTPDQLRQIMPRSDAATWAQFLSSAMSEFGISTPLQAAAFLGQAAHESQELTHLVENLNYSAQGLMNTFEKYFYPDLAKQYAHNPELIANHVYGNRLGNGPDVSGDGYRYRGRGIFQLTGKNNYDECGRALGSRLVEFPEQLTTPALASRSAAWFWHKHDLNMLADYENIGGITKVINGGYFGLAERMAYTEKAKAVLLAA